MNEYELLGGLHEVIDNDINPKLDDWIEKHNVNYCLLYPLAAVELGAMNNPPENLDNLFKRGIASFVYANANKRGKEMYIKKFNIPGFKKYLREYEQILLPLFQNYRFSREINDINPFSKARLLPISNNKIQLTTSLVTDKYREESFYFFGEDDPQISAKENQQTTKLHFHFWEKIVLQQTPIKKLMPMPDNALYQECVEIIEKDIKKWEANVRSEIFDTPKHLAYVLAFFYYHAMIKSIIFRITVPNKDEYLNNADECIMLFDKKQCIHDIAFISHIREDKIVKIVDYLINKGNTNILEFPLFEIENSLITIPSLFLVNDWQFTIINGHYAKNKIIKNREKTISQVTEKRLDKLLSNISNIATAKTKPYSFINENGDTLASDIDYAVYDKSNNIIMIIEAKWIDKHYTDEIDKRYGMILQTLNGIYTKQISKHKQFLSQSENIDSLFKNDERYESPETEPCIVYLAVDKRNQMHINDKHMISEYMLIYFIRKYTKNNILDLSMLWNEINSLETKVEYISTTEDFYEITVSDKILLVEKNDLYWDY